MCAALFTVAKFISFFFFAAVCPQPIFVEHTCCSNVVNSKFGKQTKRCEVDVKYINISKLTVGVKHSIIRRSTFSPNPHFVEEETCFPFFAP